MKQFQFKTLNKADNVEDLNDLRVMKPPHFWLYFDLSFQEINLHLYSYDLAAHNIQYLKNVASVSAGAYEQGIIRFSK